MENMISTVANASAKGATTGSAKGVGEAVASSLAAKGGCAAGTALGASIGVSCFGGTLAGSSVLGAAAAAIGIGVTAPLAPVGLGGAVGTAIGFGAWKGVKSLFS